MDWNDAKTQLNEMDFPNDTDGWNAKDVGEQHFPKKGLHHLITNQKYLSNIGEYEVEAKYNYCKDCGEVRNKVLRMYNNQSGVMYEKWFKWHGQDTKGRDITEMAKNIFAVLALLIVI